MIPTPLRLLLLSAALALCACAATPVTTSPVGATAKPAAPAPTIARPPARALTPAEQSTAQLHVMSGELAAGRKQPQAAAREFIEALKLIDDADLAQRAALLALSAHDDALALTAAQRWHELAPNEADPREVIARLALSSGDSDAAYTQCAAIVSGDAGGPGDGLRHVATILSQANKEQGPAALALMRKLAAQYPQLPEAPHALGLLALRYNDLPLAEQSARAALQLAPASRDDLLLLAAVQIRQEKLDQADAIIEKLIRSDKNPADLHLGYAKLLLEANQRERAHSQLQAALKLNPGNPDARYALGVLAFNDKDYPVAEQNFLPLLAGDRGNEAAFQLGRIAEARKQDDKALSYYERVDSGTQALDAAVRRASILARRGDLKQGRDILADLREQFPQYANRFYSAEGELLNDAGQPAEALTLYATALKQLPDDAELLYGRSLIYERQDKIEPAEADLRAILKQDADDARAMNALGYMLAVHTRRLDEARKLVARALEINPDDPAIIDSMGWVQFRLGNKAEARALLQKAYDRFPDPEIAAHLGEVMWAQGEQEQARALLHKSLAENPDDRALKDTLQRIAH